MVFENANAESKLGYYQTGNDHTHTLYHCHNNEGQFSNTQTVEGLLIRLLTHLHVY